MERKSFRLQYAWAIGEWTAGKSIGGKKKKKLFRNEKEIAEKFVRSAVNKRLRLGRYLLLFPHTLEGKTFKTYLIRKWVCIFGPVILIATCFWMMALTVNLKRSFNFLLWVPLVSSYITLLINQIWMHRKKDKLDRFLYNLQECRPFLEEDSQYAMIKFILPIFVQFLMNLGLWFNMKFRILFDWKFIVVYLSFQMGLFLCYALLEQFVLLLSLVRQQLSRTALLSDTEHDALMAAAIDLNKVFSPHLLLIITILFVALLGKLYKSLLMLDDLNIYSFLEVALQIFPVLRVVLNCQLFVLEVEKFYNRMYHYLLVHAHKIDKRMEFHLGMKRKFVFSAGGMFNVNLQLLCGMVTSAATYMVVLLQFTKSPDSESRQ